MLRFHADRFVELLNLITTVEKLLEAHDSFFEDKGTSAFVADLAQQLLGHLEALQLHTSAKKASQIHSVLTQLDHCPTVALGQLVKKYCEELRERVAHELEKRAIYYISDHVDLLSDSPLFGDNVEEAFPSAQYDISEAGRCLALRRPTACVLHLMRALEVGLASLADTLGMTLTTENWNTILNDIETEIRSRTKATHGQAWKDKDEPFFAESATHFRFIKNSWRNHAMHAKDKYTEEQAEEIYNSVRSFLAYPVNAHTHYM